MANRHEWRERSPVFAYTTRTEEPSFLSSQSQSHPLGPHNHETLQARRVLCHQKFPRPLRACPDALYTTLRIPAETEHSQDAVPCRHAGEPGLRGFAVYAMDCRGIPTASHVLWMWESPAFDRHPMRDERDWSAPIESAYGDCGEKHTDHEVPETEKRLPPYRS